MGGTAQSYYEDNGYDVFGYDKFKNIGSVEEINRADLIFICVPTPRGVNNCCDISIVDEVVGYIKTGKTVVIKSTIIPFTTDYLQQKYPRHKLLFSPEFLTERRAYADFCNPKIQIIGYTSKSEGVAQEILGILPLARFNRIMPAAAAEIFKYVRNCYLATKNSFFNQIYDLCQQTGIDYSLIKECAEADPWIGPEHLNIWQDGKRGFNGKCLPKDSEAWLVWAKEQGIDLSILREAVESNSVRLTAQNIKKDS